MDRHKKIELLKGIAEGNRSIYDLQGYVFVIQKDGKKYLANGHKIGREVTDEELDLIRVPKIFIDEQDLSL